MSPYHKRHLNSTLSLAFVASHFHFLFIFCWKKHFFVQTPTLSHTHTLLTVPMSFPPNPLWFSLSTAACFLPFSIDLHCRPQPVWAEILSIYSRTRKKRWRSTTVLFLHTTILFSNPFTSAYTHVYQILETYLSDMDVIDSLVDICDWIDLHDTEFSIRNL